MTAEAWELAAAFVEARVAEDEAWAWAASSPYEHADEGAKPPPGGAHWAWGVGDDWTPVEPDPVVAEFVGGPDEYSCTLVTVEGWPTTYQIPGHEPYTRTARRSYGTVEEMDSSAGGHILRHDPAATLRRVQADRKLLELVRRMEHRQTEEFPVHGDCRALFEPGDLGDLEVGFCDCGVDKLRMAILTPVAAVWAEHPDYPAATP